MFNLNESFAVGKLLSLCALACSLLLGAVSGVRADDPAAARFRGPLTYDFGVTNVTWEAATPEYSFVTFDLSWSYSWRLKWTEPAKTSVTGKDIEIENWDAAWVFVKFLPEKDSEKAKERNHWLHATLASDSGDHVMPAGATNMVKVSDDGSCGMGLFIFRDAIGHGRNDWKGIKLRWMHPPSLGSSGAASDATFDPAKAAIAVHAIAMVYVPEGPFKVGLAKKSGLSPFADGPDVPITQYTHDVGLNGIPEGLRTIIETTTSKDGGPYLQWDAEPSSSRFTDGGWRGGPMIPFLVDAEWNGPLTEGTRARRIGPVAGQLWSTHTFTERGGGGGWFGSNIGGTEPLNDDYPTGYESFYCMKYALTQGQYVDFLNSLPPDVAAGRVILSRGISDTSGGMDTHEVKVDQGPGFQPYTVIERGGCTITSSADIPVKIPMGADLTDTSGEARTGTDARSKDLGASILKAFDGEQDDEARAGGSTVKEPTMQRPVYSARCPFRRCVGVDGADTRAYAVWAGLRPMSELERLKAETGGRDPSAPDDPGLTELDLDGPPVMLDLGLPTERFAKGDSHYGCDLATRVGCRATPTSDRGAALATYWGISEMSGPAIPLTSRQFRGTHGDGTMPAGTPGAPFKVELVEFKETPGDWPVWPQYNPRHIRSLCRLVASADTRIRPEATPGQGRIKKPVRTPTEPVVSAEAAQPVSQPPQADTIKVTNVKWEAGAKDFSTVSFDLAWNNSWRAKWDEPAEKNVTGKPMTVESWDAAWVFVKFRPAGAKDTLHATLAVQSDEHRVPADASLDVGATDDGDRGVGVFIYRKAAGVGANDFKGIQLRVIHAGDQAPDKTAQVSVHALAMVYIPEGPFASRSPWGHALTVITTPKATQPGGHLESGPMTVPLSDDWPNGYTAYYCMKYSISQGEYADFLNSIPSLKYNGGRYALLAMENRPFHNQTLYNFNGYTIRTNAAGVYRSDVPDRRCNLLSLPDIQGFTAWAGLRMPTNLEYEKACRGPRAVATGAEAWMPATCAPAAGIDKSVLNEPTAMGPGPSYWGIRELSLSGCIQEWPSLMHNEPAVINAKRDRVLKITWVHGIGSASIPENWPPTTGEWYYQGSWRLWSYGTMGHWVAADELNRMQYGRIDGGRTGRYGARAVRTAPVQVDPNAMLQIDELPRMAGADVGVFHLTGRFNNTGDRPLNLELAIPIPDVCFLDGPASRAFTAAPKAVTPFKITLALTYKNLMTGGIRGATLLPVQLQVKDGKVLQKLQVPIQMGPLTGARLPVLSSVQVGEVAVRITNATERACAVAVRLSPVGVTLDTTATNVSVAAGSGAHLVFATPRQAFTNQGPFRIPYGITVASADPQNGEAVVDLRTETRWWITKRVKSRPKAGALDEGPIGGSDPGSALPGLDDLVAYDRAVFKASKPPKDWTPLTCGASLVFGKDADLPSHGSAMLAATRVETPVDRDAVLNVQHITKSGFTITVWVNDAIVLKQGGSTGINETKPFTLHKDGNTLMFECRSRESGVIKPGTLNLQFSGATDGKPINDLLFDIENVPVGL
ncbi:MAG: hypothetical protein FJ222_07365 [Lentisphaerae bacterium]|nr:hypothetical protein [Lentisphaerota bacterium]